MRTMSPSISCDIFSKLKEKKKKRERRLTMKISLFFVLTACLVSVGLCYQLNKDDQVATMLAYYLLKSDETRGVSTLQDKPSAFACWKRAYGRGVGKPLSHCRSGEEKNGALCYPNCRSGFSGAGPVCWQNCPSGFRNDGAHCFKPSSYGRGAGYAIWSEGRCRSENPQGCEKSGLMWYPRCRSGFKPVGCCVCSPICPSGMADIGVSCRKQSYGRTAGKVMICAPGLQQDAGLCYTPCRAGHDSVGPVCWQRCPSNAPHNCGAMCVSDPSECSGRILDMAKDAITTVKSAASKNVVGAIKSGASFASRFVLPLCD